MQLKNIRPLCLKHSISAIEVCSRPLLCFFLVCAALLFCVPIGDDPTSSNESLSVHQHRTGLHHRLRWDHRLTMLDTPNQSDELNSVRRLIAFKHGARERMPLTTEAERRDVHGDDIVDVHKSSTDKERECASLDTLCALKFSRVGWSTLKEALDQWQTSEMDEGGMKLVL